MPILFARVFGTPCTLCTRRSVVPFGLLFAVVRLGKSFEVLNGWQGAISQV